MTPMDRRAAPPAAPERTLAAVVHNEVTAWLVLAMSLLLTVAAWYISTAYVERRAQERFQFEVQDAKFTIAKRMQEYEQALRGGVGLFDAVGRRVTRSEWRAFVRTLNIETYFPGLQGMGFAEWVTPAGRAALIERVRAEGYPAFDIKPPGQRDSYSAIVYLEPFSGRNLRAFGYDMFTEATRRSAMEQARDTGQAAVSGRVILVQETEQDTQAGFLMYLPVYQTGAPLASVAQRRAALLGFVYSPFRMRDLMHGILGQGTPALEFRIYDGGSVRDGALLFDAEQAWLDAAERSAREPAYSVQETLALPGRNWTVVFSSRANFERDMASAQPELIAVGGLVVDLLLFSIIWSLARQRDRVQARAAKITAELRRSREQYRAITETAIDAVFSLDGRGMIIYCNPSASAIFGLPAEELIGKPISALLGERPGDEDGLPALLLAGCEAPIRMTVEAVGRRANGDEFPLEVAVSNWRVEARCYFTLLLRDITERKKIERMKNEFVATVSHELRTPLTAIRGALGLLQGSVAGSPGASSADLVTIAYRNTERLVHLVNDILDLEKIDAGKLTLDLRAVAIAQLLESVVEETRHYAVPHNVPLQLSEAPDVRVLADPHRLTQVVANLLSNAIKFSPPGTPVTVAAQLLDGRVRVSVTDRGIGIPESFRERVFQRFSQADASDSRRKSGSGLGLSISKSIVELHGGSIGYDSSAGGGTCFFFEVPVLRDGDPDGAPDA